MSELTRVFVYGTLLRGESNHDYLSRAQFVRAARTRPEFSLRDLGAYPALVGDGERSVHGEVYDVDGETLAALDRLEGHPMANVWTSDQQCGECAWVGKTRSQRHIQLFGIGLVVASIALVLSGVIDRLQVRHPLLVIALAVIWTVGVYAVPAWLWRRNTCPQCRKPMPGPAWLRRYRALRR